jgi:hypothetical protein
VAAPGFARLPDYLPNASRQLASLQDIMSLLGTSAHSTEDERIASAIFPGEAMTYMATNIADPANPW